MQPACSTSGRSAFKPSSRGQTVGNTFSVEQNFGGELPAAGASPEREYHPLATGEGHP